MGGSVPNMLALAWTGLAALVVALVAVPPIKRVARRVDLVDRPDTSAHKSHRTPTPYGGGVAIWGAAHLALWAAWAGWIPGFDFGLAEGTLWPLLVGGAALFFLGLADDWRQLPPLPRLLAELAMAGLVVALYPEMRLCGQDDLWGILGTALWIATLTNAFNFLDNMDGLSPGIAAIVLMVLAFMAWSAGLIEVAALSCALAGGALGFLFYNFVPASIFMGDAGGLGLGFIAGGVSALLSGHLAAEGGTLLDAATPLLVLTVPLYDLVSVVLLRLRRRIPPWIGDHNHISHRLVRGGLSRRGAVLVIYALTLATALPAPLILMSGGVVAWLVVGAVCVLVGIWGLRDVAGQDAVG